MSTKKDSEKMKSRALDIPALFQDRISITMLSKKLLVPFIKKDLLFRGVLQDEIDSLMTISRMKVKLAHIELLERGMHTREEIEGKDWKSIKAFMETDKEKGLKIKLLHS